jgi:hypothetical protein
MYDQSLIEFVLKGFIVCIVFSVAILLFFRVLKIKTPKYVYVVLVALLLTWDNIYVGIAISYLCGKEGGEHVYKVVQNVDGYYDENSDGCDVVCQERLINQKFKFIETANPLASISGFEDRPDWNRFYLAEKGSRLCKEYYKFYKKRPDKIDAPYCIASEEVRELRSKYAYHYYNRERVIPFINKVTTIVKDIKTEEELGRAVTFHRYGGWLFYLFNGEGTMAVCPQNTTHYEILYKILKN